MVTFHKYWLDKKKLKWIHNTHVLIVSSRPGQETVLEHIK